MASDFQDIISPPQHLKCCLAVCVNTNCTDQYRRRTCSIWRRSHKLNASCLRMHILASSGFYRRYPMWRRPCSYYGSNWTVDVRNTVHTSGRMSTQRPRFYHDGPAAAFKSCGKLYCVFGVPHNTVVFMYPPMIAHTHGQGKQVGRAIHIHIHIHTYTHTHINTHIREGTQ